MDAITEIIKSKRLKFDEVNDDNNFPVPDKKKL